MDAEPEPEAVEPEAAEAAEVAEAADVVEADVDDGAEDLDPVSEATAPPAEREPEPEAQPVAPALPTFEQEVRAAVDAPRPGAAQPTGSP